MNVINKTVQTFRNKIIGFTYLFEDDTELTTDLKGELIDYSGIGYNRAKKYLTKLTKGL